MLKKKVVELEINNALNNDEFVVYYQPQIDIKSGKVFSTEALIRWKNPKYGLLLPSDFIQVAEKSNLIVDIGNWVLKTSCLQNKLWHEKGFKSLCISVNVSEIQLYDENFVESIKKILEETNLEAKYLQLEITERILIKSFKTTVNILEELKKIGVKIALDDFGTGYSSLSYLTNLPVDLIKIDKLFIEEIESNAYKKIIIEGIVKMARDINIDVIVEGVEEQKQLELLKDMNCTKMQGFLFSKPSTAQSIENILTKTWVAERSI